ncbi:flagellar hook-associated protein FlgK [Rhizobium sp. ARZ01]|uniref:flagellar hook-associated protein FlgK n=1 Tax=Rhizobium sp. ARZ01 TaxID=2769313 RepID=UPI0017823221|nr:flagellar hook-associated protein FlgK [Rhizobium sp. ARZ01]MBD9373846.1 flagellar hook-associated protein FlgK [Rhizobium sp. ARZ01]
MSLSTAIKIAQSSFSNTAIQTAVASKNVANASNTAYNRRAAVLASSANGSTVVQTFRAQNEALQKQNLLSISKSAAQDTTLAGLVRIKTTLGGDDYELSTSNYLSTLRNNLQAFADKPSERSLAETVIANAVDVANSLNSSTADVQKMRAEADADIKTAVDELNRLLSEFKTYNDQVKGGTAAGTDVNDALDQRDKLLTQISEIVGVSTLVRTNNDMALYTSDGTVLFETVPRSVTFTATMTYTATVTGNQIYIDGVAMPAGKGGNTSAQGTLSALLQLRDDIAPTFQTQLDEMARTLVDMFSETVTSPGPPPTSTIYAGLFTWGAGIPGAANIKVNNDFVTAKGGDPMRLRDGAYDIQNPTGEASYSVLLEKYALSFETTRSFSVTAGIDTSANILNFATASIGWVEQLRSSAATANDDKSAMLSRTQDALKSVTAVSLDEELALLLDLEQSYKASAKLVAAVDEMMTALLQAAG